MSILRLFTVVLCTILCIGAADAQQLAAQTTKRTGFQKAAEGLFVRERVAPRRSDTVTMAVWDVNIGPGQISAPFAFPGGSIVDVRVGTGTLMIDNEKPVALKPGAIATIDEGRTVRFDNREGTGPLTARLTIIRLNDN